MSKNPIQKTYREYWVREESEPQSLRALKLGLEDSMCWEWEIGFTESPDKFWGNQDLDMEYRRLCRETREELIRKQISGYYIPSTVLWTQGIVMIKIANTAVLKKFPFNRPEAVPSTPLSPRNIYWWRRSRFVKPPGRGLLYLEGQHLDLWFVIYRTMNSKNMGYMEWLRHWYEWNMISQDPNFYCLPCLRNLYAGQEATVRTWHRTTDWFQIGKGVRQGCTLSPCLFNFYGESIMRNPGLEETQPGIKIAGRNINNLICRWHHPYGRKWRRAKEPLDESERGESKSWLKAQHSEN